MVDAFVERIPLYGLLPREQLDGEILDISRYNLGLFFAYLRDGALPGDDALEEVRASAARRAEERIPLEALLTAYQLGATIGWEALRAEAGPHETGELLDAAGRIIDFLQLVNGAVASAYAEERQAIYGEERDARRALVEALLTGAPAEVAELAGQRAGVPVEHRHLVVALQVGTTGDEAGPGVGATVAGRRKQRRMEQHLSAAFGGQVLSLLHARGGTVLVPLAGNEGVGDADTVVKGLEGASGADVTAGAAVGEGPDGMAAAAAEAREVLRLVRQLGRPPGAYRLDDVVVEFALTRPSEAAARLAALLEPLDEGPELVATLEGWFAADFDRRAAATALAIHPNTLDYRLRRVAEITGLEVHTAHGVQVLGAALAVRRLGGL